MTNKLRNVLFYITLFLFIVIASFQGNTADYDLFARLLQGQAFWQLGNILHHDIFSYTPTHTWFDHEWGSSVVFYWVFDKFGQLGFLWLKALMIFGIFTFSIEALKIRGVKFSTPYNILFYYFAYHAAYIAGFSNTIRCQLFTYLFFAIWIYLLERVRKKGEYYWLATFVPMMLFWSNIHGGCAAGLGLLVLYTIGEMLNKKPFKYYIFALLGCTLITFANPWGIDYVKFLLMATTMKRILIAEWQPTFGAINAGDFIFFKIFFCTTILLALIRLCMKIKTLKNIDWTKAVVMTTMTFLCLKYTRHQPFFVLCTLVFMYDDFYKIISTLTKKLIKPDILREKICNIKELILYSIVAIATICFFVTNKPQVVVTNNKFPIKPIEFIKINELKGNLLVNFHHGSYAAYKLYPHNLIAMDGRYEEVYNDYMLPMFNNFFMQVGENPNMIIEHFRPDIIVMEHKFKADEALSQNKTYQKAYSDEVYSVYVDKKLAKKSYKAPSEKAEYYNKNLFETRLKFSKPKK